MANVMDTLKARGFVRQITFEEELYEKLGKESVPFYIGFDPTADSLHVGHFMQLIAMHHMQQAGHKPIILIGGGTAMIGDPSGRTDMRSMMTKETIRHNVECFKQRLERGLSFLEFNYMLMQGYDFLVLYKKYGCLLELGGDDQWSNILAGANLIRIKEQQTAFGMTFTLLATSDGKKMGKTAKGAVWLDENKTTPYEFYQYWRNIDDGDVENCMKLLTFLPLEQIEELCRYKDERMNKAKEVLAYELTKEVHGEEKASIAQSQAKAAFGGGSAELLTKEVENATTVVDVMVAAGIAKSKGEARRLIEQGGVSVDETKVVDANMVVPSNEFVLHKGKKVHVKIIVK